MPDIATVSVIASATLAALTIGANVFTGERQRRHEADLDFEGRVWDQKSTALFAVIRECHRITERGYVTDANRLGYALRLSEVLDALHALLPAVEAFASSQCRKELNGLINELQRQGVKMGAAGRAAHWRKQYLDAFPETGVHPVKDMQRQVRYHQWAQEAEQEAVKEFKPDLPELRGRAQELMDAARESVRRPKD